MKKRIFLLFMSALLAFTLLSIAVSADNTISAGLGSYTLGAEISQLIVSTDSGSASCVSGAIPYGCYITSESYPDGIHHMIKGTPSAAGYYDFTVSVTDASGYNAVTVNCSLSVTPSQPQVSTCTNVQVSQNTGTSIYVNSYTSGDGYLSYQWYVSTDGSRYGSMLSGETGHTLYLSCQQAGTFYYYCKVTNNSNGLSTSVDSDVITVSVLAPSIQSVYIYSTPSVTSYKVNDNLNYYGLQLGVKYTNGAEEYVTSGFTVYPSILTTAGQQLITVNYNGYECSYYVNVEADVETIQSIGVASSPYKTSYAAGDRFVPDGLSVRVYTNRSSYDITSGYSYYPEYLTGSGYQTITVSYEGFSCSFDVYVETPVEESISIAVMPKLRTFTVGDTLDTTGMVITVINGNDKKDIITGFTCTPSLLTKAGTQEILVSYNNCTTRFYVTVTEAQTSPSSGIAQDQNGQIAGTEVITNRPVTENSTSNISPVIVAVLIIAVLSLAALCATSYISQNKALREKFERFIQRFDR